MEGVTIRYDSTVPVDVEVDITIADFEAIDELTSVEVGDTGRSVSVCLKISSASHDISTEALTHVGTNVEPDTITSTDLGLDEPTRHLLYIDLAQALNAGLIIDRLNRQELEGGMFV